MPPDRPGREVFPQPTLPIRTARDGAVAGAIAGVVSGAPSTLWALLTGGDPLEAARAAGSILVPNAGSLGLYTSAAVVHSGLSLAWGVVLAWLLPRRRPVVAGAVAGLAIATLDLGIVGRHLPRVRALPSGPQVADHLLYGITVAAVLSRSGRRNSYAVSRGSRCR